MYISNECGTVLTEDMVDITSNKAFCPRHNLECTYSYEMCCAKCLAFVGMDSLKDEDSLFWDKTVNVFNVTRWCSITCRNDNQEQ